MIIINNITGFSASSRKSKETLDGFINDILKENPISESTKEYTYFSTNSDCITKSLLSIFKTDPNRPRILYIGKSMGGVKTWWMLKSRWHAFKRILDEDNSKIAVVLIDPHGASLGDGIVGSYGTWMKRTMAFDPRWAEHMNFRIDCIYQRDKYPRGAKLSNNTCNERIYDSNHWDVTDIKTKSGRTVADLIEEQLKWLSE